MRTASSRNSMAVAGISASVPADLVAAHVELPAPVAAAAQARAARVARACAAADDGANACQQLVRWHALAHVVVRAQIEQLGGHGAVALAGDRR